MRLKLLKLLTAALLVAGALGMGHDGLAQNGALGGNGRPAYRISAQIDYQLMALRSTAQVTVPVAAGDTLRDAVFFIYANAAGVGGGDGTARHIVVERVTLDGQPVAFKNEGALLRVALPQPRDQAFTLQIETRGVVPRSAAGSGGIMDMLGGMGGDLSGILGGLGGGGDTKAAPAKPQNTDYGLYTFGNGILSLGSFWYPTLAVRQGGRWIDEQPQGLGDVGYSDLSDFAVALDVPANVTVAATGDGRQTAPGKWTFSAPGVRDFAVLMSDNFAVASKTVIIGGRSVAVQSYCLKQDAGRANQAIDVAANALQIYSRRFGAYPYNNFKVVEGPIRGGAGGMEFSGLTSIASMLYQDLGKELGGLAAALGGGNMNQLMAGFEEDGGAATDKTVEKTAANPAQDMLGSLLGQQQGIFESLFETTIAHETAHQWWAISVGSDSQRAPFVDESLTNYSAMLYFEDRYGRERAQQMVDLHLKTTYSMGRMLGSGDAPANLRTSAYANNMQYGAVIYGKGALYYDAARRTMGDQAFFASLRDYYGLYQGKLAAPGALVNIMQSKAPAGKITTLHRRWVQEAHGDEDITGGKAMGLEDLLGGMFGGLMGAE